MRLQSVAGIVAGACLSAIVALVSIGGAAQAQTSAKAAEARGRDAPSDIVVTEAHIFLIKFVLQLRPEQEWHWAPVEAALRDLARQQAAAKLELASTGRAGSGGEVALRLRRIALLARPLIKALDDGQRRKMVTLARSAGLAQLLNVH